MELLEDVLAGHHVVICAGSGGVGKTTTAASIALRGALAGRRTIVLTIDPAKRLANALGMSAMQGRETVVQAPQVPDGMLSAMMLDQKGAWDELVERHASSDEMRQRIFQNRFYQYLSEQFAGSQEYMAIEQLCELDESGRYDLIVVDTPPTRHALDFLEAPQRLADFFDRSVVKWFVRPYFSAGWSTMRLVNRTAGFLFRRLEDATGISALVQVSEFFTSMAGLFENFEPRVRRVYELLRDPQTAFVLVAAPDEQVLSEAEFFISKVQALGMRLRAVVFNRAHFEWESGRKRDTKRLTGLLERLGATGPEAQELTTNFDKYQTLGRGDALRSEAFRQLLGKDVAVVSVPNFSSDVHSLDGLREMHAHLFAATGV